jgi:hypothetical protein
LYLIGKTLEQALVPIIVPEISFKDLTVEALTRISEMPI